jgi:hypothetical protein
MCQSFCRSLIPARLHQTPTRNHREQPRRKRELYLATLLKRPSHISGTCDELELSLEVDNGEISMGNVVRSDKPVELVIVIRFHSFAVEPFIVTTTNRRDVRARFSTVSRHAAALVDLRVQLAARRWKCPLKRRYWPARVGSPPACPCL